MNNKKSWLLLIVVVIVVLLSAYFIFVSPAASTSTSTVGSYQAVFLVNNQVYFGKLANQNGQFPVLTDIYYLQVNQPIQPVQGAAAAAAAANPEINLVKLGGELHGPTDMMRINRDQILLVENLRSDSNLVSAIENYKNRQEAPAEAAPAQ